MSTICAGQTVFTPISVGWTDGGFVKRQQRIDQKRWRSVVVGRTLSPTPPLLPPSLAQPLRDILIVSNTTPSPSYGGHAGVCAVAGDRVLGRWVNALNIQDVQRYQNVLEDACWATSVENRRRGDAAGALQLLETIPGAGEPGPQRVPCAVGPRDGHVEAVWCPTRGQQAAERGQERAGRGEWRDDQPSTQRPDDDTNTEDDKLKVDSRLRRARMGSLWSNLADKVLVRCLAR